MILYGGAEDYGVPNSLNGWAEYQPPVTNYMPVQNNYASNTTVKQKSQLNVPDMALPALPSAPTAPTLNMPSMPSDYSLSTQASVSPIQSFLPQVSAPQSAAVAMGLASGAVAPGPAGVAPSVEAPAAPAEQAPNPMETADPARLVPGLSDQLQRTLAVPPRARGTAPAGSPEPLAPRMDATDLQEIYDDVRNQMKQIPIQGLTRGQKFGFLVSPEARKLGIAKLVAEQKARAEMAKGLIDDRIEVRKAEMAKELTAQQETQVIKDFINGTDEEREALLRRFPNLSYYKDIPQSREASLAVAAKEAGHIKNIAAAGEDIYKLMYSKADMENKEDQSRAGSTIAQTNARKAEATYESDVAQTQANARKAGVEADIAERTKEDKIAQEQMQTNIKQWEVANQPLQFMKNNQELIAQYNDIRQKLQDGQMKAADGILGMGSTLMKAAESASMAGDEDGAKRLRDSAMQLFNMGAPLPEAVVTKKGEKPVPQPLNVARVGQAATSGAVSAQGGMMPPTPPTLTLQGGVEQRDVKQVKPGDTQLFQVPPPPPMMPFPQGLPMAGAGAPGGIGGGPAGHQVPGGGFAPPPPPGAVDPRLLGQYPQLASANGIPQLPQQQQPLQGGVQTTGSADPVQAFNQAMQPPAAAPQAAPPQAPQQAKPGFFEGLGQQLQSGRGAPPMLGPNNPPQGAQRFLLGGMALGRAFGHAVGGGIGGAINRAVSPYRMPPPEEIKAQYEAQAERNADKMEEMVVTPWVTPKSRGLKNGAMLTDPELYSYFAHKGRDQFTMNALIRRAGWTLPPPGFNGGDRGAAQPLTPDYQRFKRFDDAGGVPLQSKPGDEAPYRSFNPRLLNRRDW